MICVGSIAAQLWLELRTHASSRPRRCRRDLAPCAASMLPSGGHQQPKRDAGAAGGDEKVDEPASEYARLQWFVMAWLVGDSLLLTFASLSKESRGRTYATHLEMLTWPICMSMCCLYFFGTLDSSAVGRRAVGIWAGFWAHQAVFVTIHHWSSEAYVGKIHELFGAFLFNAFLGAAFAWLMNILRSELRALDSLDTTRMTRLLEIMGLQTAVGVIALTQGIGPNSNKRLAATALFQLSLCMAWLFSIAIFDVSGIDPHLAVTKLRLGLVEGSALFFTGIMVLCGFSAYVLSEQSRPKQGAVDGVWGVSPSRSSGAFAAPHASCGSRAAGGGPRSATRTARTRNRRRNNSKLQRC